MRFPEFRVTEPHSFRPLRPWDVRSGGRCRACYLPMSAHPIHCWVPSRPLGDKRKAVVHGIHLLIERLGNPDISDEEFNEILAGLALCPYCWQKVPGRWSGTLPTFSTHNNKNGSPCFGSGRVVK